MYASTSDRYPRESPIGVYMQVRDRTRESPREGVGATRGGIGVGVRGTEMTRSLWLSYSVLFPSFGLGRRRGISLMGPAHPSGIPPPRPPLSPARSRSSALHVVCIYTYNMYIHPGAPTNSPCIHTHAHQHPRAALPAATEHPAAGAPAHGYVRDIHGSVTTSLREPTKWFTIRVIDCIGSRSLQRSHLSLYPPPTGK